MAAVNCYLSVTSTATPKPQDSTTTNSTPPPHPRQTKVILPKKKPMKWSTGVAPGDYGGPPTTTKLRKYWGQDEDPLTSDDFIWNKKFMGRMKKLIQENAPPSPKEAPSGFLSLNRVMSLDSLEVDLTEKLIAPSKPMLDSEVKESSFQASSSTSQRWRPAPTRREQDKWDRAAKAATGGSEVLLRETRRTQGDPNILAAQSSEQYLKLKNKLQFLTLGIGGVGILSAYVSYSPEIAASYGAGLLGSLMYMRMLGNSVDSIRTDGAKALIKYVIQGTSMFVFGFGFAIKTRDYKVVRMAYAHDNGGYLVPPKVEVYALSSGIWKEFDGFVPDIGVIEYFWIQAVVCGKVHWTAYKRTGERRGVENLIMVFDLNDEIFQELSLPDLLVNEPPTNLNAAEYRESLAVYQYDTRVCSSSCAIWVMKQYGVTESWSKEYNVALYAWGLGIVLGFSDDSEILLTATGELASYNPETQEKLGLGVFGTRYSFYIGTYEESLVLLDKGEVLPPLDLSSSESDDDEDEDQEYDYTDPNLREYWMHHDMLESLTAFR